jgi:hypothetical protein
MVLCGSFRPQKRLHRRKRTRCHAPSRQAFVLFPPPSPLTPSLPPVQGDPMECPCIQDMKNGPCGPQFVSAYRCFLDSTEVRAAAPRRALPCSPKPFPPLFSFIRSFEAATVLRSSKKCRCLLLLKRHAPALCNCPSPCPE